MRMSRLVAVVLSVVLAGCGGNGGPDDPRSAIEAAIARGVEATRAQDIAAFMATIPEDFTLRGPDGTAITREDLRAGVLRDWSIIPRTLAISVVIDSLEPHGDSALVFTSQRWERLMLQRDGVTTDTVLTTQRHRETWRRRPAEWFAYEVEELGGEVFVNGEAYQ